MRRHLLSFVSGAVFFAALSLSTTAGLTASTHGAKKRIAHTHHVGAGTYGYVVPARPIFGYRDGFVRGWGIVDEACNLPTSACPNTQRDTQ
jgi:hypothetical protein